MLRDVREKMNLKKNVMELIGVGLRSVMMVGSGVDGMKLIEGHRCKCSRQGGMEFKHVDSLWRLL